VEPVNARAILVTGASRGIGRAIALAFAARGDRVAVHHRGSPEEAAAVLAALPGPGHVVVQADVTDPGQARRMVDEAAVRLGGLDVLVNNAGVYIGHPVAEVSYEQWQAAWQQTLAVNLIGPANVTWCAVQHMIPRGGGRIVNVSSRGAFRGEPGQPAYGASKGGLNAFGIAVTTVAPGFVDTEMAAERVNGPDGDQVRAQSPFDRIARPEEVAEAVVYLASADAEWASGTILDLNGASYLRP
jgi:NAD(P)-dependent dehydrogenase (short-subunit alcohol dehydrogenase family)